MCLIKSVFVGKREFTLSSCTVQYNDKTPLMAVSLIFSVLFYLDLFLLCFFTYVEQQIMYFIAPFVTNGPGVLCTKR